MSRIAAFVSAPPLYRPAWLACGAYAAVITAALAYAVWPGFMSYDSVFAYQEGLYGIQTMLWPPLHAYMFTVSQRLGLGAGGVFVLQTFVLFGSAALVISTLVRSRLVAGLLCLAFAVSFVAVPPQLGVLSAHWRDVPTAAFALLALALWLQAARLRSPALLAAAAVSVGLSVALRYNAFALLAPLIPLMLWRPWLTPAPGGDGAARVVLASALVVALGTAWASTQWRLPDLLRMPTPASLGGAQQWDVIGVSACAGRNYLPAEASSGVQLTVAQIRAAYDPRHMQKTLQARPDLPRLVETDAGGKIPRIWRSLLVQETGCYVRHRMLVLVEQLGMAKTAPFYPVHGGIDANAFGLTLARPGAADALSAYVQRNAGEGHRRPYLLYVGALIAVAAVCASRRPGGLLLAALLAGVFGYLAPLILAAPAADARYIFPSNTVAALIMVLAPALALGRQRS
ncbi:MAG: hypothetical protein DI570_09820 [Phenylobacterium zucineum]|nr:MAG: hypothetical protein DI570_09820 [Phenylobacterium zucineum]